MNFEPLGSLDILVGTKHFAKERNCKTTSNASNFFFVMGLCTNLRNDTSKRTYKGCRSTWVNPSRVVVGAILGHNFGSKLYKLTIVCRLAFWLYIWVYIYHIYPPPPPPQTQGIVHHLSPLSLLHYLPLGARNRNHSTYCWQPNVLWRCAPLFCASHSECDAQVSIYILCLHLHLIDLDNPTSTLLDLF